MTMTTFVREGRHLIKGFLTLLEGPLFSVAVHMATMAGTVLE